MKEKVGRADCGPCQWPSVANQSDGREEEMKTAAVASAFDSWSSTLWRLHVPRNSCNNKTYFPQALRSWSFIFRRSFVNVYASNFISRRWISVEF